MIINWYFLKKNELVSSARPKDLENEEKQVWWVMEKSFSWSSMKPSTIINQIKAYSRQRVHLHHQNHLKEPRKFWDNMWRPNEKEMLGREYGERKKFFRTHWMVLYGADNDLNRTQQAHKEGYFSPRPVECFLSRIQISLHFVCWRQI